MSTRIIAKRSDGSVVGRCDARCHESIAPVSNCTCICEGRYHGSNLAPHLTIQEVQTWLRENGHGNDVTVELRSDLQLF